MNSQDMFSCSAAIALAVTVCATAAEAAPGHSAAGATSISSIQPFEDPSLTDDALLPLPADSECGPHHRHRTHQPRHSHAMTTTPPSKHVLPHT